MAEAPDGPPPLRVFIIAGEASGDALGGALMQALAALAGGPVSFHGIGGPDMAAQGLVSLFDYAELSVMGLVEVLPHAPRLLRRIRETASAIEQDPPDVLITIDSPGFVFRVVKRLRRRDFPRIHYVAPTVWAWKPGRVHKFRRHFDHLLALLPFEPDYFSAVGLPCTFVGHPVVERDADAAADRQRFRAAQGIADDAPLLCVLPGSRRGELDRHIDTFGEVAAMLAKRINGLAAVMPTLPHLRTRLESATAGWPLPVAIVDDAAMRHAAMRACDAALAASGTVTLELAQAGVPTIVGYRVALLTAALVRLLIRVEHVSIVNLIAGRAVTPEFLQQDMQPAPMAETLYALFTDPDRRAAMQQGQAAAMVALGAGGEPPSHRAAAAVLDVVRDWRKTG